MHFTKLRLSGFKSFVDQTELLIRPGLTGVIGPNGCGKSNLLEAMRWVMGETSAKSMRGAGMEDVIFAGAQTRPPRNYAEVSLAIDNSERRAPSGFNETDELEITRRIARDLGSTYRHNGKEIRARDAQTLFADAATGSSSPALVRQGRISELINAKPKARRRILEDAAGVAGLHARRHEAILRLNSAESNLTRIVEVLSQLEAREASLTREADRAKRYRTLSKDLRLSEAILLFRRWREADRESSGAAEAMEKTQQAAGQAVQAAAEAARKRIALEEKLPALREEEAVARAMHHRLQVERQALESKEREAQAAATRTRGQIEQLKRDLEREIAMCEDARVMLERLTGEQESLAAQSDDPAASAAREEEEQAAEEAMREAQALLDRLNASAARSEAERASALRSVNDSLATLERLSGEQREAAERIAALGEEIAEAETRREDAAAAAEEARERIAEADEIAAGAEEARGELAERAQVARAARGEAEGAVKALQSEAAQLRRLVAAGDAADEPILDRVRAEPGFEAALGAALGDDLQARESDDAGWGWTQLPPLDGAPALPAGARPLSETVAAPPALARRLSQTGVVEAAAGARLQAQLAPGQRLVSVEGDVWRWDGFSADAESASSGAARRLEQRNRLEAVEAELAEAEARSQALIEEYEAAREADAAAAARDTEARDARRRAEREAADADKSFVEIDSKLGGLRARRDSADQIRESRQGEIEAAEAARQEASARLQAFEAPEVKEGDLEKAKADAETARARLIEARGAREAISRRAEERATRLERLTAEIDEWTRRQDNSTEQRAGIEERIESLGAELEAAAEAPAQIEAERAALSDKIAEAENRLTAAVDALAESEAAGKEAARLEREAEAAVAEAREERARLETRAEGSKQRAVELAAELRDAVGCEPDEFLEKLELDPEALPLVKDLERAIVQLRQSRDKLGAVNLRADEELTEVSTEREGLQREQADLDAAISKLRQGVNALNKEGRERLIAAFEEVNRNFSSLFTQLFDGGNARLTLVESDDPLEAGLEILCQPPGKRLSSLSLLSGGEQTLTAISLIFAVFMVNPAPICVLDEVDAPLDDANVARFCNLLDEMTRRTQTRFLIITHHAVTMSRMHRLFGVTMVERGVSQLVSVDLETAVEMVDA